MEKLEYKVGSKKKEIEIIELNWDDYCIQNPNGSQFTHIANFVMLYTGKKPDDMMTWKDSCKNQAEFNEEIALVFSAITKHMEDKKK